MLVKIYFVIELFPFLPPATEKLISGSQGHPWSSESQAPACMYLFTVENKHKPRIRDQGHLGSPRGGLAYSERFASGSSIID